MRPIVVALALVCALAMPAVSQVRSDSLEKIQIRPGFLGTKKYFFEGHDVSKGPVLREVFRSRGLDIERDELLAHSENQYVWGTGILIVGLLMTLASNGNPQAQIAALGVSLLGGIFSTYGDGLKLRAVHRFNGDAPAMAVAAAPADTAGGKGWVQPKLYGR